jgi:urea transport system permease protein
VDSILQQLFIGVSLASVLLLIALGLTFTFGQMGVINMAHGEFIMAGAFAPFVLQTNVGFFAHAHGMAYLVAIPVAFLAAGILGLILERLLLRRLYGRTLDTLLVTFGVSLILQQVAKAGFKFHLLPEIGPFPGWKFSGFGEQNVNVTTPTWLRGQWTILGAQMPHTRLFIIALVIATIGLVWTFANLSPQGRRMRAVMQNRELAAVSGLHTRRVDAITFFLGSGLAGVAGVAIALIGSVGFSIGGSYIVDAFLVVIVGGLGKLRGAVIAALTLGLLSAYTEYYWEGDNAPTIAKALVFAAVILFLQFRPNGLVSFRTRGLTA